MVAITQLTVLNKPHCYSSSVNCFEMVEIIAWLLLLPVAARSKACGSAAARMLRLQVRIPPRVWISCLLWVLCRVEVSASGWSLVQRSPTGCGVSSCAIWKPHEWGGCDLHWVTAPKERKLSDCSPLRKLLLYRYVIVKRGFWTHCITPVCSASLCLTVLFCNVTFRVVCCF